MAQGVKGTRGVVVNITIPEDTMKRIEAQAHACFSTRTEYLRRFIIENIDLINPQAAP
jgi:hypothetical protein